MSHSDSAPYEVLRNPNFLKYLSGRFSASLGQQMLTVAVGWELYERTHSPLSLGLVGAAQMAPMILFTLPAGHWADNANRKTIVVWMTGIQVLASICLTFVSRCQAPVPWIYACLFLAASARTFLWPASTSFLTHLVPRSIFPRAVAWNTGSFHLSAVSGPAVGGALLALTRDASIVYALNALAGLFCLIMILQVHYRPTPVSKEPMTLKSLASGFSFVFSRPVILGTLTLDLFAVLLGGATALLPVYAKDILHSGPTGLGTLQGALPLGSLLSALIMAHRPPLQKAGPTLLWAVAGFGVATIGFGLSNVFWFSWLMLFLCGVTDNISVVIRHTLVQMLTTDDKRGRVSAVNSLFIGTSNELGGFESGLVAQWFGPIFAVVSGGIGTLLVVVGVALYWPQIRRYGRLDSETSNKS